MSGGGGGIDLIALAREAMLAKGFPPDMPAEALAQAARATPRAEPGTRDLRGWLWSSIDNDSSKDLDQVEYAEALPGGRIRVCVAIADVDALAAKDTPVDRYAAAQTVSVYAHALVFPMLPERLSTDLSSLNEGAERLAMVSDLVVDAAGEVVESAFYPARVLNRAKLTYNRVGAWLEGRGPAPEAFAAHPGLEQQVRWQDEAASALRAARERRGALRFARTETQFVMEGGRVKSFAAARKTRAAELIEDFMLASNQAMARELRERGCWSIRRVVEAPRRWDRIVAIAQGLGVVLPAKADVRALSRFLDEQRAKNPSGFQELSLSVLKLLGPGEYAVEPPTDTEPDHFSLAALDYTHSTAPNRRYADLVTQRLLKAALRREAAPYSPEELTAAARRCTVQEDQARKVERLMDKRIAAMALADNVGEQFEAVVTGVNDKGTFVRVQNPPAEGRLCVGQEGADVGDHIRVKLTRVDVRLGHVDFCRAA